MRFDYTASDRSGAQRKGKLIASNLAEARESLEQLGMQVVELRPADENGSFPRLGPPERSAGPPSGSSSRPDLPKSAGPPSGSFPRPDLPKSAGPPSGSFSRPDLPKSAGPPSGSFSRPDLPRNAGPPGDAPPRSAGPPGDAADLPKSAGSLSRPKSGGPSALRPVKASSAPAVKPPPAKASSGPEESLLARLDWKRLGPLVGGLVVLIGLVSLFFLNQPRKVEVTLKGQVSVAASKTQQNVVNPFGNLTLYVYFPDERRLISAKGVAEPTGKRWKGIKDPNHHFKLDIQPDGKYELKLSFTASRVPQRCTLTINKPGYSTSKKRGLALQKDGNSLVATVTRSSLRLLSRDRKRTKR